MQIENKCLLNVLRTYLVTVVSNMQHDLIAFVFICIEKIHILNLNDGFRKA